MPKSDSDTIERVQKKIISIYNIVLLEITADLVLTLPDYYHCHHFAADEFRLTSYFFLN